MSQQILPDLVGFRVNATSSHGLSKRPVQPSAFLGTSLGSSLTGTAGMVWIPGPSGHHPPPPEPLSRLGEQLANGVAVFPKSDRVIVNDYGVFVPLGVLGQNTVIKYEQHREPNGTVRVNIFARPREAPQAISAVESIDCTTEIAWLAEHREEYAGQWVALEGDRLIAAGFNASEVYESARNSGVELPLVVQVEHPDALPFGGW